MISEKKKEIDRSSLYDRQEQYLRDENYSALEAKESRRQEFDRKKKYKKNY